MLAEPEVGCRVILADAGGRARDVLGTVIDHDPHRDSDLLVEVLHDDGVRRWRRRDDLRVLGKPMAPAHLAADLRDLLGEQAPSWAIPWAPSEETRP
jgi:hypothetical protein